MADMNHQTNAPSFISVSAYFASEGTYYLRAKVPKRSAISSARLRSENRYERDAAIAVEFDFLKVPFSSEGTAVTGLHCIGSIKAGFVRF